MAGGRCCLAAGVLGMLLAAGCSADQAPPTGPAVSGWYDVTHHTFGAGDCVVEGADATGLPVIRLTDEQYNGTDYVALRRCREMEPAACDAEDFFHGTSFIIPVQNGWQERKASAAFQPGTGDCYLTFGEATLMKNGAGVIIEIRRYEELETGVPEADCNHERALERGEAMSCLDFEVIHGQPPVD